MFIHTRFSRYVISASVVLVTACGISTAGTNILFGVQGDMALTGDMTSLGYGGQSQSKILALGPTFGIDFPSKNISFEASILYRRIGYDNLSANVIYTKWNRVTADSLEVPLIFKYYPSRKKSPIQPFVSGGPVVRIVNHAQNNYLYRGTEGQESVETDSALGFAVGTGFRFASGHFRISPEMRYTKWIGHLFYEWGSRSYLVASSTNRIDFSLSIAFAPWF